MSTMVPTNSTAYAAWTAGSMAGTNIDPSTNWMETTPETLQNLLTASGFSTTSAAAIAGTYNTAKSSPLSTAYSDEWYKPGAPNGPTHADILKNIALKGGFNAIRFFFPFQTYKRVKSSGTVVEHDITTIAELGWDDTSVIRNTDPVSGALRVDIIPRYNILAAQITNLLALCQQLGMGVVLCVPMLEADQNVLWNNQTFQDDLVKFWAKTAQRWKGFPALIGYEIINEPSPPLTYQDMRTAPLGFLPLMNRCIKAIREKTNPNNTISVVDDVTPIIVSSPRGSSTEAFDFFFTDNSNSTSKLFSGIKLVYTCHVYAPEDFANQGISTGNYLRIGSCYPSKAIIPKHDSTTGSDIGLQSIDFMSNPANGMAALFANVITFKQKFSLPVFLGEFGASSTRYHQKILERDAAATPPYESDEGAFKYSPPTAPERQIVGLLYSPTRQKGYIILGKPVFLNDRNAVDEFGYECPCNTVDVQIKALPGQNIGLFDGLRITNAKIQGLRRWLQPHSTQLARDSANVPLHDENFYIEFPWTTAGTVPLAYGRTTQWGSYFNEQNVEIFNNPSLIPEDDVIGPPSGFREAIKGGQRMNASGTPSSLSPPAPQIASIKIILTNEQVKKQEASRVAFTKDILKRCATSGSEMSWAWNQDLSVTPSYLWGDKFFEADHEVHPATETGGKLRAVLKNASNQLIG